MWPTSIVLAPGQLSCFPSLSRWKWHHHFLWERLLHAPQWWRLNDGAILLSTPTWPQMTEVQEWASKPAQSEFFPGSFADVNWERDRVPRWWQNCEISGVEAAGGCIFNIWKKPFREKNVFRCKEAHMGDREPWKVHISLFSCPLRPSCILVFFTTTHLLISPFFAQAALIGFLAVFK